MFDQINTEIRSFYNRYASRECITYAEATERVSNTVVEEYERKAKKYVEEHDFGRRIYRGCDVEVDVLIRNDSDFKVFRYKK